MSGYRYFYNNPAAPMPTSEADIFTYEVSKGLKKLGKIDANVKKLT